MKRKRERKDKKDRNDRDHSDDQSDNDKRNNNDSLSEEEDSHRHKKSKKKRTTAATTTTRDNGSGNGNGNKSHKKTKKHHHRKHKRSSSSSRHMDVSDESRSNSRSNSSDDDSDNDSDDSSRDSSHDRRKRRRKHRDKKSSKKSIKKASKKTSKKDKKDRKSKNKSKKRKNTTTTASRSRSNNNNNNHESDDSEGAKPNTAPPPNATLLANALFQLFTSRPEFAADLPTILIRLAGGSTFDLRQVTDDLISSGLQHIFTSLSEFGVERSPESGMWFYNAAPGRKDDERFLLRAVRSLLDQAGLTMEAVRKQDVKEEELAAKIQEAMKQRNQQRNGKNGNDHDDDDEEDDDGPDASAKAAAKARHQADVGKVENHASSLLKRFFKQGSTLHQELQVLCKDLMDGQSISLEGLPDEDLKKDLDSLFRLCKLEECEMADDDDDDKDDKDDSDSDGDSADSKPVIGYCLSDGNVRPAKELLAAVISFCNKAVSADGKLQIRSRAMFPSRQGMVEGIQNANSDDESDDEGPAAFGAEPRRARGPALPKEVIKMQAEARAAEMRSVVTGIKMAPQGGREEWMLEPGKFDLLSNVKKKQMKGKSNFDNLKSHDDEDAVQIDSRIQREIDSIMDAHANARGPSLMDHHRSKQHEEKMEKEKARKNGKGSWNWNRNSDLDKGRRVDKDALQMIMGGAGGDLKTKFQGGLG